ncbi:RWD repeat domain-containing protein [Tricharina praecox]|uniref:RWD repeat domain-containing protein n=1 Tax=Tricharina praecox TaxID=43433 RepID=UPI00221FC568|nr:RWD repeat domain-containing protein [Tricharina praecox]KAI5854438.1 RWD repeat domain-containing protein [Tricharina praecox]
MNDDLSDETAALNAIYSFSCLICGSSAGEYILQPPASVVSPALRLRLHIPLDYPASPPTIIANGSTGAALAQEVLDNVFRQGEVCLYDLVEGLREVLGGEEEEAEEAGREEEVHARTRAPEPEPETPTPPPRSPSPPTLAEPTLSAVPDRAADPWTVGPPITEKKSVFIARSIHVSSAAEAHGLVSALISGDKKIQKATHNISAFRIVRENGVVVQDNDDDGETAAGSRLAHLLQVMDVKDVCVVVSRWYGGVKLGPDRFRLINTAAREALVLGGFVEEKEGKKGKLEEKEGKKKGKGKK